MLESPTAVRNSADGYNDPMFLRDAVQAVMEDAAQEEQARRGSQTKIMSLHLAARRGDVSSTKMMIAEKADVNKQQSKDGTTPLMFAASWGHDEVATLLLAAKADVNSQTHTGDTALMFAASGNHVQVVKKLIDEGANINHQAAGTESALLLAASKGNTAVIDALLAGKGDVNISSKLGVRPLHYAARMKQHAAVASLVNAKADLESRQSENQWTALMDAAHQGSLSIVKVLVESKADTAAVSKTKRNALQLAQTANQTEVVAFLSTVTQASGGCKCSVQ